MSEQINYHLGESRGGGVKVLALSEVISFAKKQFPAHKWFYIPTYLHTYLHIYIYIVDTKCM